MDVKRYSAYCSSSNGTYKVSMAHDSHGDYVLVSDYDKLNQEVTELTQLLADEREKANARIAELELDISMMMESI